MRSELKKFNWFTYGLTVADFDYTVDIVSGMVESRMRIAKIDTKNLEDDPSDAAGEILSDVRYYAWIECQYLWHFCLWRLQATLEGIITTTFLPKNQDLRLAGLNAKLNAMTKAGYYIDPEYREQLLDWARLRNALSHCPPEQYRPLGIDKADIAEYVSLAKAAIADWGKQKPDKPEVGPTALNGVSAQS